MEGKPVKESAIVMSQLMSPQDANLAGNVHGGVIMYLIDTIAGVVSTRHAKSNVVTASIDRLDFHHPAFIGDLLTLKASLNHTGKSSMEIGVRVETENLITGAVRHTASAYLTYVALDKDGKPKAIPPVLPETEDEKRRFQEARARRELRLCNKNAI